MGNLRTRKPKQVAGRCTISLGMSLVNAVTSIVADRRYFTLSLSVRQMPQLSGRSGTQRARLTPALSRLISAGLRREGEESTCWEAIQPWLQYSESRRRVGYRCSRL